MKYQEKQRFTQWWLWLILIGTAITPIIGICLQLAFGEEFGLNPMSDNELIIFFVFTFSLIALFLLIQLKTEIDDKGIRMRYRPFLKKNIEWKDIESAEVINYGFVGGWGIRIWTSYGTVYNTSGKIGLAIKLKNGKKFLIGTQKEEELRDFFEKNDFLNHNK